MMGKNDLLEHLLTRENFYKLLWTAFGLTLFPGLIFLIKTIFISSDTTISAYYSELYGSLLDVGKDGMVAWCFVCAPYMAYELYLLIKNFRTPKNDAL
jgi:hypothetical protein